MIFPDAEQLLIDYLDPLFTEPVSTRFSTDTAFVRVLRTGGPRVTRVSDAPQLTFECYHPKESGAERLAANVRDRVQKLPGTTVSGVYVYQITELSGPSNMPDPRHESHRYSFTTVVHLRGTT